MLIRLEGACSLRILANRNGSNNLSERRETVPYYEHPQYNQHSYGGGLLPPHYNQSERRETVPYDDSDKPVL